MLCFNHVINIQLILYKPDITRIPQAEFTINLIIIDALDSKAYRLKHKSNTMANLLAGSQYACRWLSLGFIIKYTH